MVEPPHEDVRLPAHGSVAPDGRCTPLGREGNVARLRDLIGPEFLLLLVCRTTPERAAAIAIRAAGLAWPAPCRVAVVGADRPLRGVSVLRDDVGELVRAYGAAGSRAWLIRPDGHLAGSMPLAGRDAVDRLPALQAMADRGGQRTRGARAGAAPRRRSLGPVRLRRHRAA